MTQVQGFELITIRLTRGTISSLLNSEEGRHEDYQNNLAEWDATPSEERTGEDKPEPCLAYVCAMRALESKASSKYATIRIFSADEAEDLYYAVCSGTFQIHFPDAARRIADALRDRVCSTDPDLIKRWPGPTGG